MFVEEKNKRKIDLGNKKVVKKEDFLKKLKEEKTKDQEKEKIEKSNRIICNFLSMNINKIYKSSKMNDVKKNLNSIISFIHMKKELDPIQKEKLVIAGLQKTIQELNLIFKSINLKISDKIELSKIILTLLNFLNQERLKNFLVQNLDFLFEIMIVAIKDYYISLKKDYLIDEKLVFFSYLEIFIIYGIEFHLEKFYSKLAKNVSAIFFLNFLIKNIHRCIHDITKNLILKFNLNVCVKIVINRIKYKFQNENLKFANPIIDNFLENSILKFLENFALSQKQSLKIISSIDLLEFLNSPTSKEYLKCLNEEKLFFILTEISAAVTNLPKRNCMIKRLGESDFDFFIELFINLKFKLYKSTANHIFLKSYLERQDIFKSISNIVDLVIEFSSTKNLNEIFKNSIEKFLFFIFYAGKLIESLYTANEKTDFHSILDFILNKLGQKYFVSSKLTDEILLYSADFIKDKSKDTSFDLLEIISFTIINKIEYKENYYFLEFRNTKDIYQNLPFNYLYLNLITKLLIQKFTQLIATTNLDDFELLNQNLIVKCLKSLYFLDNEIEFSYNKDAFWSNPELISKMTGYSQIKQLESMKIMPFVFPFKIRLTAMYEYFRNLKNSQYNFHDDNFENSITISREHIFEETFNLYLNNKLNPVSRWQITFIDRFGMREAGIDVGGLFKEYVYKLSEQAFSINSGYFIESNTGFLMPNPDSSIISHFHLKIYEFCGFIIGMGLLHDIKITPNFSVFFLNNILERENPFTELKSYDPDLYKNLVNLKNYDGDVENDFGLNFTLNEQREGKMQTFELIDNGSKVNVNNYNKLLYIKKVAQFKLTFQIKNQCEALRRGLMNVIQDEILQIFTADELRQLIYGFEREAFNVVDLKTNTEYESWNFNNPIELQAIKDFWEILEEFDDKEKEKFLFFVTSLKRPPIGGFEKLFPKFKLSKAYIEVPTSSTCANTLKMPILKKKKMKEILKYVINADSGFYFA